MMRRRDGQPNRTSIWAVGLIALGLVLLLGQISVLSWAFRFWPLVAIGFGLDLLRPREARTFRFGLLSLALLGVLVLFGPAIGLGGRTVTETFRAPLEDTRSTDVRLDLGAAPTRVSALADPTELIRADVTHRNRVVFSVRGGDHKTVRLDERDRWFGAGNDGGRWNIGLNPDVPAYLEVDGSSAQTTLNLGALELTGLALDNGSGRAEITLPASAERYEAELDGGSGRVTLSVADGAELDATFDGGSGALEVALGRDVAGEFVIDSGSGAVTFTLPADAAGRLEVEDRGPGAISVAPRFQLVDGDEDEGVWETPGYETAERAVLIHLEDGGSGPIRVR